MIYAKIDPATGAVLGEFSRGYVIKDARKPKEAKARGKPYILPVDRKNYEPFDPATQVRIGPVYTVLATKVNAVYRVRSKTAQETDDEKSAAAEALVADPLLRAFFRIAAEQWAMTPDQLRAEIRAKI